MELSYHPQFSRFMFNPSSPPAPRKMEARCLSSTSSIFNPLSAGIRTPKITAQAKGSLSKTYGPPVGHSPSRANYASASWYTFYSKGKFNWSHDYLKRHNQVRVPRYIVARSEIAGTGYPDAAHQLPELQLVSKVKGFCFYAVTASVAIILFMLMLVAHPFVLLFDRYRRKAHHQIAKMWALLTVAPFLKVEVVGLDNLPSSDTPAVYVSNHQSFLDIYTLLTLGRSFKFISKTSIFLFPIIGWAMFLLGAIPLKRMDSRSQLQTLKRCINLVKKGGSVFYFPEGTRSKDGKLGTFKER
ncbi:1-acyl-sn-glycerol-3-phosphate acyltransferase BAT2, chloroplastic isoform X2 [Apium graveolens]|uniref:1-acyl-sn-glycerol-3-phosphate acyltransferase BAT2, chloroplastic isoform X2 n=1 Tax=Apium graveolens TaxID=4045 RepID=UPI003D78F68A